MESLNIKDFLHSEHDENYAILLYRIGDKYQDQGDICNAYQYFIRAYEIQYNNNTNSIWTAFILDALAKIFEEDGDNMKAIEYYEKSIAVKELIGDKKGIAENNYFIAVCYSNIECLDEALAFCLKALPYYESVDTDSNYTLANLYSNIGDIYWGKQKLEQALTYKTKYLDIICESDNYESEDKASAYQQVGELYLYLQNFNESIGYFQKSIEIMEENDLEDDDLAMSYFNLAKACLNLGIKNNADACFYKSLEILDKLYDDENPPTDEIMEVIQIIQSYFSNNN